MSIFKSIKGFFGQTIHYKDGAKVGETWDGFIPGTKNHYDADGEHVGYSAKGWIADEVHYDQHGARVGESWTDDFGTTRHYGDRGFAGVSYQGFTGTTSHIDDDADTLFDQQHGADDVFMTPQPYDDIEW